MVFRRNHLIFALLFLLGLIVFVPSALNEAQAMRAETGSLKYHLVAQFLIFACAAAVGAVFFRPRFQIILPERVSLAAFWLVVTAVGLLVLYYLTLTSYGSVLSGSSQRWLMLFGLAALIALLTPRDEERGFRWMLFFAGVVWVGSILTLGDAFRESIRYPFRLSWSEGNRFWDYSVLFGRHLYQYPADQPIPAYIDIGRQSLWGLIFLLPDVTIQGMRFWNAFLFTIPYAVLGWAVFFSRRENFWKWFFLGLWAFLFLNQGPIYTPLVLSAILVVAALNVRLLPALLLVILSGYYAQLSRYTWMFAPAIWAGVISLIQTCPPGVQSERQRWGRAVSLGLAGLLGGLVLPRIQSWLFGAPAGDSHQLESVGISGLITRQPLLWDRLLPNSTYDLGILLALLLAAAPMAVLCFAWLFNRRRGFGVWQKLAVIGMVTSFLAVGLVVSVKIGGGSNLHNLDMLLIALLLLAGMVWQTGGVQWFESQKKPPVWVSVLLVAAVVYPLSTSLRTMQPIGLPSSDDIAETLQAVQTAVDDAKSRGEVLFLDHRQLLTFGYVKDVPLVPDYEKKWMMDEAMSDNAAFFHPFYLDITSHRFALIVSEPLHTSFQGSDRQFANENDAFVFWVSRPLLCYYKPVETFKSTGVQLLVPRERPCELAGWKDSSSFPVR